VTQSKNVSEATAQTIDREIRRIVEEGHQLARTVLSDNRHNLDRIAQALLEHETLTGEDIAAIMRGEPLANVRRDEPAGPTTTPGKRGSVPTTRPSGGEPPPGIEPSPQPGA
jgi:cell division protease FtsH